MKVGNNSIQGIYKYDSTLNFEKGDFVINDGLLYVANAEVPAGVVPGVGVGKDYYDLYLAGQTASDGDFESFLEGTSYDNFVSPSFMCKVINSYMTGLDSKGIICDEITEDSQVVLKNYFDYLPSEDLYTDPLDRVMAATDLNNAVMKVAGSVTSSFTGVTGTMILRQSTYTTGDTTNRLQELFDPDSGVSWYRSCQKVGNDYVIGSTSSWKISSLGTDIKNQVETISSYYSMKTRELSREKFLLRNQFCFASLSQSESGVWLFEPSSSNVDNYVTICFTCNGHSYSICVDVSVARTFKTPEGIALTIRYSSDADGFEVSGQDNNGNSISVIDVYQRLHYYEDPDFSDSGFIEEINLLEETVEVTKGYSIDLTPSEIYGDSRDFSSGEGFVSISIIGTYTKDDVVYSRFAEGNFVIGLGVTSTTVTNYGIVPTDPSYVISNGSFTITCVYGGSSMLHLVINSIEDFPIPDPVSSDMKFTYTLTSLKAYV